MAPLLALLCTLLTLLLGQADGVDTAEIVDMVDMEDKEDVVDTLDTAIRQLPVGLDSGMLRDYAYNFLNFMLNYVGILVHAVILQLFIQP